MPQLKLSQLLNQNIQPNLLYFGVLLLFSSMYSSPSIGGTGFSLSFNISVWVFALCFITAGLLALTNNKKLTLPNFWLSFLLFPSILIANSLLMEINQPITWLFRLLYILGGLFFLCSLFQFSITTSTLDRLLLVLIICMGLHALLGCLQIHAPHLQPNWVPRQMDHVPRSLFQQINMHVSFLATGLISSLYLISRPSFHLSTLLTKSIIVISFSLGLYIIAASGSRIGLLSILLGIPLVLGARYKLLRHHKKLLRILHQ